MAKKSGFIIYILYFFERIFLAFCIFLTRILPIKYIYSLAEFLGGIGSRFLFKHRRRVMENLNLAFSTEKNWRRKLEIYRNFNINFAKNSLEMLYSANNSRQKNLIQSIHIVGQENLDRSLQKGKGVIAIGGHFGSFGIIGLKMKDAGYRFHTVARAFTDPLRKKMYEKYRMQQGQSFIYTRTSTQALKRIIQVLRKNEIVFLISDENKRHGGVFVNFFNHQASTNPGPALLHLRTGADIIPIFLFRNQDNTHKLIIEPPLKISYRKNYKDNVEEITRVISQKIEEYIRKYPSQWMWTQRRWRTRPPEEKAQGTNLTYRKY